MIQMTQAINVDWKPHVAETASPATRAASLQWRAEAGLVCKPGAEAVWNMTQNRKARNLVALYAGKTSPCRRMR